MYQYLVVLGSGFYHPKSRIKIGLKFPSSNLRFIPLDLCRAWQPNVLWCIFELKAALLLIAPLHTTLIKLLPIFHRSTSCAHHWPPGIGIEAPGSWPWFRGPLVLTLSWP